MALSVWTCNPFWARRRSRRARKHDTGSRTYGNPPCMSMEPPDVHSAWRCKQKQIHGRRKAFLPTAPAHDAHLTVVHTAGLPTGLVALSVPARRVLVHLPIDFHRYTPTRKNASPSPKPAWGPSSPDDYNRSSARDRVLRTVSFSRLTPLFTTRNCSLNMPAVQQSAPKWELMLNLDLNDRDDEHKRLYMLMKNEAITVYDELLKGRRSALKPQFIDAPEPWSNNQFLDSALRNAISTIVAQASPVTRPLYARAAMAGDNWVAKWMLYHVCRYRDGRNLRARSIADFHADDVLFSGNASGGSSTGSSQSSTRGPSQSSTRGPTPSGFYDAARNSYRPTAAARNVV